MRDVSYRYADGNLALDRLSFSVQKGERLALVGPNGAGKSTLLNLMAGLCSPSQGAVEVMGEPLSRKQAGRARRHVGLLFQDPDDQIFMPTVQEDVSFGPMNIGIEESEVRTRVKEALRSTSLEAYRDRAPHRLSIGEKKRVAIAGLLAMSPEILLLDEPTANLDPQGRREFVDLLEKRNETVIIATHDLSVAFHLARRVLVLKTKLLYDGDVAGLMSNEKVIQEARLELPSVSRLIKRWGIETGHEFRPPATVEEALEILRINYCSRKDES